MQLRNSFSPQRKCFTPCMWDNRQPITFKKSTNRYLKTEDVDVRTVHSRNDDQKKKVSSIVQQKKNRSMSHHKQSLNSSFNARTVRTSQQITNRKSSLQNRLQPYSTTHENQQQYFPQSPSKRINQCNKLIESKKFDEALKELEEIDGPQMNPIHLKDVAYLKGLVYMNQNNYDKAISQFSRTKQGELSGQVAMLQAVCYKKLGNLIEAINALKEFQGKKYAKQQPIYYDLLIFKGKLLIKIKKFTQALQDFNQACTLEQETLTYQGTLGRGDCLRLSGKYQEALQVYESIPLTNQILMRKILCFMEIQAYDKGMEYANQYIENDTQSSEGMYIKGQIHTFKGQINEGLLCFEQAIKYNNSRKAVTKALLEIGKIKIEQRDFYAAYYTLQRSDHLDVEKEAVMKLRQFTEGVISLMKRKYQDAVNQLSSLINNYQLGDFIKKLIFQYRAYGFICINKYQKALNDLIYVSNLQELDVQSQYNKTICDGIIMAQQNQFEKAISQFQKASKLYPGKMEPHFYKSMTLMQFVNKHLPNDKDKYIKNALKHLDKAITLNDSNSNLLYHRGILRFYFGLIDEALQDLNKTVEKNEEHIPKYFYARGLVRACLSSPKQALSDFTIAINWDSKYAEAYLNRAKVFTQLGDRNSAFNDLQTYISLKPSDPDIHLWAGNLLFNIGAYEHAIKTYSHSPEINNNLQLLKYRSQCQIIMKELNSAMIDLQRIIELTGDKKSYIDKESLLALKTASMGPEESQINQVIKLKNSEKLVNYRIASQMLKKLIKLNFDGYVFQVSDLYFYRGVMKFYLQNYRKAIDHWTKSYTMKQQTDENNTQNIKSYDSLMSQQDRFINELEELEFEDRTYNMYEYYFNVAMATYLNKQKSKAKDLLNQLAESLSETYETQIKDFIKALDSQSTQSLYLFPYHNRLCCIFPTFKINQAETRLSFCLPHIAPPSMNPEFDKRLIEGLQPTVVDNKPEAPWIKRNPEGVVFTENVQIVELDLRSESQRSQAQDSQLNQQEDAEGDSQDHSHISINDENINIEQNNDSTTYQTNYKKDIELLKQQLRLDQAVELRLARLK